MKNFTGKRKYEMSHTHDAGRQLKVVNHSNVAINSVVNRLSVSHHLNYNKFIEVQSERNIMKRFLVIVFIVQSSQHR